MSWYREHVEKRFTRSSTWSKTRKRFLVINPRCVVCGKKKGLEVHHILPFYLHPDLEEDFQNLLTLCRRHHFSIGHLEKWKSYNKVITPTVEYFKRLLDDRP